MEAAIFTPADFIQQLKDSLIPELKEQLKSEFQPKQPTEYLTTDEVCDILKITKATLSNWRNDQIITAYGIGARIYFKRSELDELINRNKL
ncbi:helix-turn-helix domain-containing protein [uncultured Chryseobacterium sp.]|uniref:helix-turn-helix domain-containing protein n=1 Tax=uncultured Chryseobacterium sp. TaxID=259322 RepID=UPI0025E96874|nr:helix-turn-helix domain-containing protein [uncultured Chryseobacterium sp.]